MKTRFALNKCSLGFILVAMSEKGICAVFMSDDSDELIRHLKSKFPHVECASEDNALKITLTNLIQFIETPEIELDLPLDIRGTDFQRCVWQALREIPLGTTASYTDIAKKIGAPKSARAVALACAANTLAVVIPCHRVVRTDGSLSGYRWGVQRKEILLKRESNCQQMN